MASASSFSSTEFVRYGMIDDAGPQSAEHIEPGRPLAGVRDDVGEWDVRAARRTRVRDMASRGNVRAVLERLREGEAAKQKDLEKLVGRKPSYLSQLLNDMNRMVWYSASAI
jgi:hypothetical protein